MANKKPSLEQRVLQYIQKHSLLSDRRKILVAVSGGPDSVCLLHVLANLKDELGIDLHVVHLDHQLRGAESASDALYVADLAITLGVPVTVEKRDVLAYQKEGRLSLEEAAREVRYSFFAQVAEAIGADAVAVGHTLDDHIETVLMHIIRGTGTRGLVGLKPEVAWRTEKSRNIGMTVIRPLLEVSREETAEYCRKHNLSPRLDASNLSMSLFRNRIRHELMPLLERYNPQITESLLRISHIAQDDIEFLDGETERLWRRVAKRQENNVFLKKEPFLALPDALKRNLLRVSIERLLGTLKDIEMRHIEEIMEALSKPAGKRLNLPFGLVFAIDYDEYLLSTDVEISSPFPPMGREVAIKIPGETVINGWRITADVLDKTVLTANEDSFVACFDFQKAGDNLTVRNRRHGDRFQPLGMSQTKKLGEFMVDAKIPRAWRDRIPIVCSGEQILWVVAYRIDDRFRVTESTTRILRLRFERR